MYTGFVCGLGCDEEGRAMFPERDMEVIFDCEFTTKDFILVNKLRFFMSNLILAKESSDPMYGLGDVISFQDKIKECFKELIEKHRQPKELEFPAERFKWNIIEARVVIDDPNVLEMNKKSVYPIHMGVNITSQFKIIEKLISHLEKLHKLVESKYV